MQSIEQSIRGVEQPRRLTVSNRSKFIFLVVTLGLCLYARPGLAQQVPPQSSKAEHAHQKAQDPWWKHAGIYEIYQRSFQDSNGAGDRDSNGITSRLASLHDLGSAAIWISPM